MAGRFNARIGIALIMLTAATLACNVQFGAVPTVVSLAPPVSFIAPDSNSTVALGATVSCAVLLTGDKLDGSRVEFLVDGASAGTGTPIPDPAPGTMTFKFDWTPKDARGYLISAQASRPDGSPIGTADITVQVVPVQAGTTAATGVATQDLVAATLPATVVATEDSTLAPPTKAPTLVPTPAPLPTQPSAVPLPTNPPPTNPPVPTSSSQTTLKVTFSFLNVRAGPGLNFPTIAKLVLNDVASVVGRNADSQWLVIEHAGVRGWVYNTPAYMVITGDIASLPLVASPPTPTPGPAQFTATPKLAPTSTVGTFADLVIDAVTLNPPTPTANQTFIVTIVVRNQGSIDATSTLLTGLFQPQNERSDSAVPAIPAGQSVTINLPVTLKSSGSNLTGTITVDANNNIAEGASGEANNVKTITYSVN